LSHIASLLISGGAILLGVIHLVMYFTTFRKASNLLGSLAHFSMVYLLLCAGPYTVFNPGLVDLISDFGARRLSFFFMVTFVASVEYLYASMAKFRKHNWTFVWIITSVLALIALSYFLFTDETVLKCLRISFYVANLVLEIYCFRIILDSLRKGDRQSLRLLIIYSVFLVFIFSLTLIDLRHHENSWMKYLVAYIFLIYLDSDIILRYRTEVTPTTAAVKDWSNRFTQQIDDLRSSNASKDKFLSIVAHDLKNPISSLKVLSDMYSDDAKSSNDLHRIELAQMMNDSINSVYRLLDNLLTWARAQNGSMKCQPEMVSVGDLISNLNDATCLICQSKNIKVNVCDNGEQHVYADSNMLQTILRNLVTNSVKFSFADSSIDIIFDSNSESHIISVADHGVGMSKEAVNRLFRVGEVSSTFGTNKERGTGLGLLICNEFAQKHGGRIAVESQEGVGTTFSVILPKKQKTEDDIASPSAKKNEK